MARPGTTLLLCPECTTTNDKLRLQASRRHRLPQWSDYILIPAPLGARSSICPKLIIRLF